MIDGYLAISHYSLYKFAFLFDSILIKCQLKCAIGIFALWLKDFSSRFNRKEEKYKKAAQCEQNC